MEELTRGLCGVYCIENTVTGEKYVGCSRAIQSRWKQHLTCMKNGFHEVPKLNDAWRTHGATAFRFSILEIVDDPNKLEEREIHWMSQIDATRLLNRKTNLKARTHISIHTATKQRLEAINAPSINAAITLLLDKHATL